ncbi:MAG: hypothetical protein R3D27_04000 [Hyphomicrobiaceae bacterium]
MTAVRLRVCPAGIAFGALAMAVGAGAAFAHSWYPYECCKGDDCAPVTASERPPFGRITIMTSRHGRVAVPDSFPRRPSPDNSIHLCVLETPRGPVPRCLFVPGTS